MLTFNQIGVPMIDGVIAGIKSKKKELEDTFTDTLTDIFLRGEVIDELTSDFRIFQDLVSGERYYFLKETGLELNKHLMSL